MHVEAGRIRTITSLTGEEHSISWSRTLQLHRTKTKAQDKDRDFIKIHRVETQSWTNERLWFIAVELIIFNVSWNDWVQ